MNIKHQIIYGSIVGTVFICWLTDYLTVGVLTMCIACSVISAVNGYMTTQPRSDVRKYSEKLSDLEGKTIAENATLKLRAIFESLEKMITMEEFDSDLQDELSAAYPKYKKVLLTAKQDLLRKDCSIVITGETSSGKSTLMNILVGRKIFPVSNVAATGKVCRVRNSEMLCLRTFDRGDNLINEETAQTESELKELITKYSGTDNASNEMANIFYVDVHLPVDILKGNVIIVDTPGIGESEELDKMLINFLPSAVSMIFVVNAQNAGGIHKGRLLKIFCEVLKNLYKMPCFDPNEVIFLTNKWDIIEIDDTAGVNEHEKTWGAMITKLKDEWAFMTEENVFKVSLKQGKSGLRTFSKELRRFEQLLHETIERNQNKRIKHHYSFLEEFIQNAERGTLARLHLNKRLNADHLKIILNITGRITILQDILKTKKIEFESDCQNKTRDLTNMLHQYLNSKEAREQIMTPKDDIPMLKIPLISVNSKLNYRFENAIQMWLNGDEMKSIVNDVDAKIHDLLQDITLRLNEIGTDMTGLETPMRSNDIGTSFMSHSGRTVSYLSRYLFVMTIFISNFRMASVFLFKAQDDCIPFTERLFSSLLSSLSKKIIGKCFENSFKMEYEKTITYLFDHKLKQKVETLERTNYTLNKSQEQIRKTQYAYRRLHVVIQKIEKESNDYLKTIKQGQHISNTT